jgi:glutathione-regulated potassium-efflux system ancillary protein KefF
MILILQAHPYPSRSRATEALLAAIRDLPNIEIRSLYDLYPDFDIDIEAEQAAMARAGLVVWLHPIFWYSVPAMLKHYFDVVLTRGWAYAEAGGSARMAAQGAGDVLVGKHCLWVATTGGKASAYAAGQMHAMPFDEFAAPLMQTAEFCGMVWTPPITLHDAHAESDDDIKAATVAFRERLIAWQKDNPQ